MTVDLVVLGPPRTKKNSPRIFRDAEGRPFVMPSKGSVAWAQLAIPQLRRQWAGRPALTGPVHLRCVVHRATRTGDLVNYVQSVQDALQRAGVLEDDKQVLALDALMGHDKQRPRVEIRLALLSDAEEVAA